MRLRKLKRILQAESQPQGRSDEPREAQEAVEQSKIALGEIRAKAPQVREILERNEKIQRKNGFGRLADQLFEQERRRRTEHNHGKPA